MDGKVLYRICIDTQRLVYRLSYRMTSTGNTGISHTGAQPYIVYSNVCDGTVHHPTKFQADSSNPWRVRAAPWSPTPGPSLS